MIHFGYSSAATEGVGVAPVSGVGIAGTTPLALCTASASGALSQPYSCDACACTPASSS